MKSSRFASTRRIRAPFAVCIHPGLTVGGDGHAAMRAEISSFLRFILRPLQALFFQHLIFLTLRTRHPPATAVGGFIFQFNPAQALDGWRGHQKDFPVGKCDRALTGQRNRIAFAVHIEIVRVHLVEKEIAHGHGAQADGTVRARHNQNAARKFLALHRIAAIAGTGFFDALPQDGRAVDQRGHALLRPAFGHFHGRLHRQHRAWRMMDDIADPVVACLGATNLRALHEHDFLGGIAG